MENLDEILEQVLTEEHGIDEARKAGLAEKMRQEAENKRQREFQKRQDTFEHDIKIISGEDNPAKVLEAIADAQKEGIVPDDYLSQLPKYNLNVAHFVKSPEMADLLLSKADLSTDEGKKFAEAMLEHTVNKESAPIDKMFAIAQKYNISPSTTMNEGSLENMIIWINAGANPENLNLAYLIRRYEDARDGYTYEGGHRTATSHVNPAKAEKYKAVILHTLKAGYPIDVEELKASQEKKDKILYRFLAEVAREREAKKKFESFSAEDKEFVGKLKRDNIEEVRQAIGTGTIKPEIMEYMKYGVQPYNTGDFFKYYCEVMNKDNSTAVKQSFITEEDKYLARLSLEGLDKVRRFNPEKVEKMMKTAFMDDLKKSAYIHKLSTTKDFNYLQVLSQEGLNLMTEYLVADFDKIIGNMQKNDNFRRRNFLTTCIQLQCAARGNAAKSMKQKLLEYRTSGSDRARRQKVEEFRECYTSDNYLEGNKRRDRELEKLLTEVSYTPMSALNTYLRKQSKENS